MGVNLVLPLARGYLSSQTSPRWIARFKSGIVGLTDHLTASRDREPEAKGLCRSGWTRARTPSLTALGIVTAANRHDGARSGPHDVTQ
jgi:hypothetical protein